MFAILSWGLWGQILFAALLAIALFYLLKLISLNYFNCLVITTQRLIDFSQNKAFERSVKETDFDNIAEVSYKFKGLLQNLSRAADLEIKLATSPEGPHLIVRHISSPEKVQNLILDLKKLAEEESRVKIQQGQIQQTYQETLAKIKKDIGPDGLERLVKSLDQKENNENNEDKNLEFLK